MAIAVSVGIICFLIDFYMHRTLSWKMFIIFCIITIYYDIKLIRDVVNESSDTNIKHKI
ncbi:hypothetical phage membrane protein [Campylobacter phage CP220]|uniref:Hypothetical phage membrane protein n=1 Tax=Campylobacter phage CP220 TaxID=2994044 RepID=D5GV20_9CAUD|nr:membrane protein [Campylobacter phage CP220]CBJ93837.1 hypothetical phage membrane protein [Campylobacter phage CP220]